MSIPVTPKQAAFVTSLEGAVASPYYDSVGVLTWGVGHTAAAGAPDPSTLPDNSDQPLERVFSVFMKDLQRYADEVDRAIAVRLTEAERGAAISFHYNTGAIGRAAWVRHLNEGRKDRAIASIMNWGRPPEIIPRRQRERDLLANGDWGNLKATLYTARNRRVQWGSARIIDPMDYINAEPPAPPTDGGWPILQRGDTGPAVTALQELLNKAGYPVGRADGIFGQLTEAALIRFQRSFFPAYGRTNKLTWAALGKKEFPNA